MTTQLAERRHEKSPLAYRTISEVATDLEVPQHVLRFWETKFPQVKPLKRGGGRRYYRPEDVDLLRRVRSLLYDEGYTIKGVQRLLRERGGRDLMAPALPSASDLAALKSTARVEGKAMPAGLGNQLVRQELEDVLQELGDALASLKQRINGN